jgi:hypothetical protein
MDKLRQSAVAAFELPSKNRLKRKKQQASLAKLQAASGGADGPTAIATITDTLLRFPATIEDGELTGLFVSTLVAFIKRVPADAGERLGRPFGFVLAQLGVNRLLLESSRGAALGASVCAAASKSSHTFEAGPLGLRLQAMTRDSLGAYVLQCPVNGAAAMDGGIFRGDMVDTVAGVGVGEMPIDEVMALIKSSPRPLQITLRRVDLGDPALQIALGSGGGSGSSVGGLPVEEAEEFVRTMGAWTGLLRAMVR